MSNIGEKIRKFRKRAGISQMELELEIEASPGSISRIENGVINPTKETIQKIIDVLNLRSFEAGTLFNVGLEELPKLVSIATKLNSDQDLEILLQNAVNDIMDELGLIGGLIFVVESNVVYLKAMTHNKFTQSILDLLPQGLQSLSTSLDNNRENYVVKAINEKSPQYSTVFNNFSKNVIPDKLADFIQKLNGTKSTICIPIIVNDKSIGAMLFSKDVVDNFENELSILKAFSEYVGTTIMNAQRYGQLQKKLNNYE